MLQVMFFRHALARLSILAAIASPADPQGGRGKTPEQIEQAETARATSKRLVDERTAEVESDAQVHFGVCDLDRNGWVSLREANLALGVDKAEYRRYDTDGDGGLSLAEFRARYSRMLELLGVIRAPVPPTEKLIERTIAEPELPAREVEPLPLEVAPAVETGFAALLAPGRKLSVAPPAVESGAESLGPFEVLESESATSEPFPLELGPRAKSAVPKAAELGAPALLAPIRFLQVFDHDMSAGLSRGEVDDVLRRVGGGLSADVIVKQTDRNDSGELEAGELGPLIVFISKRIPVPDQLAWGAPTESDDSDAPRSGANERGAPMDPSHFFRLDVDGNGSIDESDLRALLVPARAAIRLSAVIAALDRNGDGRLSQAEFLYALRDE